MKASEVLVGARDYLMEHGWYQGDFEDPSGSGTVCSLGACIRVAGNNYDYENAALILENLVVPIQEREGARYLGVGPWNDYPDRTFNEVMDAFDEAIILAKEQEA